MLGNQKLMEQLALSAEENKIAHAYLLCGDRGSGKKTLAKWMSKIFMCPDGGCGTCHTCQKTEAGVHPDVIFVTGSGKNGLIPIDQVRSLRQDVYVMPNEGNRKIYIIDGVHKMNDNAQDAFLKVLEEPPEYAVFILLCEDEGKMLQTVLSRVIRLNLTAPEESESLPWLEAQTGEPESECRMALKMAMGNPGKAKELLSEGSLSELSQKCEDFCMTLMTRTPYELALSAHKMAADKTAFSAFLKMLSLYLRDILLYKKLGDHPILIFGQSISRCINHFSRMKSGGLICVAEQLQTLSELCLQPISILLIETKLVTLCEEEIL